MKKYVQFSWGMYKTVVNFACLKIFLAFILGRYIKKKNAIPSQVFHVKGLEKFWHNPHIFHFKKKTHVI